MSYLRSLSLLLLPILLSACSAFDVINGLTGSSHYQQIADVPYGGLPRQRLDVFVPDAVSPDAPMIVFFYGGGWREGNKADYEFVASALTRAGYIVALPDYRLYPDVRFPDFVEDGAQALALLQARASEYGADPDAVYVAGHSAGAHIAALLALDASYLARAGGDAARLRGLIGLSGPYDFLPLQDGYLVELFPEAQRKDSQPIRFASDRAPAALLVHGTDDDTVEPGNSERLAAALRDHGVNVTLRLYDGVAHARVVAAMASPLSPLAPTVEDIVAFVESLQSRAVRPQPSISP